MFRKLAPVAILLILSSAVAAENGGPGLTTPVPLMSFDSNAPACAKPSGLSRTLAFAQDNEREFMQGVARGLSLAARDRGMDFRSAQAGNDSAKMIRQIEEFLGQKVGAVVVSPVDPASQAPHLQKLIWSGAYVGAVVPPPATELLNAPQYLTGKVLGDDAAQYVRQKLGGKAKIVLLTHDSLQFLAPRFAAMRDAFKDMPQATIVADISPITVNKEGGAAMMRTILLAEPDIDVVLGADTVVLGALQALREAGKARADQFLGGIDGEPEAVSEIKSGSSPYKMSVSLNSPVFSYAMGQHAADWLEGKSIPQAMDILPSVLTSGNIAQYEKDLEDPASVYRDPSRRSKYLRMYGNICYETRDRYINFPWSSEKFRN